MSPWKNLRFESTAKLIKSIVNDSNREALNELLENRKLFYYKKKWILLSEFIWRLREKLAQKPGSSRPVINDIIDETYELTITKFSNLPEGLTNAEGKTKEISKTVKPKQVDCRNYYRPVLKIFELWRKNNPNASELEQEQETGKILQRLVVKHFYLSRKEFLRNKRPFSVRYDWKTKGKTITLWYPVELGPKLFKEWLKNKMKESKLDKAEMQAHLQSEIDKSFFVGRRVDLDNKILDNNLRTDPSVDHDDSIINRSLADVVAAEKTNHIENLRPAIKSLGKNILGQLIHRIFDDLKDGVFEDNKIADDFGISKATFSRFAGSQWQKKLDQKEVMIPDLWKNTAKIVASDPEFIEAASEAGVMKNIAKVLCISKTTE